LVSRALARFYFGIGFDDTTLGWYVQFADPELLRSRLLETVLYLRDQPPLFNLYLGVILKVFAGHAKVAFYLTFLGCGLVLAMSLFLLLIRMQVPLFWSTLVAILFVVHPTTILYENLLAYDYPLAALLCLAALFLHRFLSARRSADGFSFFLLLAVTILTRGIYHLFWMLFIAAAIFLAVRERRRQVIRVSVLPVALALSLYVKNYCVFGDSLAGRMTLGVNLAYMTAWNLPLEERERLLQQKILSPLTFVNTSSGRPAGPRDYQLFLPPFHKTGIAVLDQEVKSTGDVNWNHAAMGAVGERHYRDALYVLEHYPWTYWPSLCKNCQGHFEAAGCHWALNRPPNSWQMARFLQMARVQTFWFNVIALPSCALFAALVGGSWLVRRLRGQAAGIPGEEARGFTALFCLFNICYATLITVALSSADHNRYRFPLMPFYFLFFGMLVGSLRSWPGLVRLGRSQ
jgi:hypothetical protein